MRFAFKTSPQNTTWAQMLAVWQEADGIDVYESGWTFDHFYPIFSDPNGPCLEGWTTLTALAQASGGCAWAPWSPASITGTRRCWPIWPPPWTSSPTDGSNWASAPTARYAQHWNFVGVPPEEFHPPDPAVLQPLAEAIRESGLLSQCGPR